MTRAAFPKSAAAILRPAIHATAAAARQRAISAALYLSAIQGAQRTALRAPRNIPRAKHRTSRNPETNVTDSGIQPRHEQSHPLREKSQTSASRTASAHLSAAVLALSAAVFLLATPAHAQSTNQLYMTGTGSGHAPTLYTNGVDSNISLAIMPKGTGGVGIGNTAPGALLDLGLAGTTTGNLRLEGKTSGYVQISPSAAAGSWTMIPAHRRFRLERLCALQHRGGRHLMGRQRWRQHVAFVAHLGDGDQQHQQHQLPADLAVEQPHQRNGAHN